MCDCIKKIDEQLEPHNLRVSMDIIVLENSLGQVLPVHTEFIDESKKKRGQKPVHLRTDFCPFCGEKLSEKK